MTGSKTTGWPLAIAAMLVLGGCGQRSDSEMLAAARAQIDKHDSAAATIELKNLLQSNPKSAEARLLLGKLMLEGGDAAGAEAELRRALEAGAAENDALPLLAAALVAQGKGALLIQQYATAELKDGLAAAELKTQLANAYIAAGSLNEAEDALVNAALRSPDFPPALVLGARLKAMRDDTAGATTQVDALLARMPDNASAWLLKGDLLASAGPGAQRQAAIDAYRKALALKPDLISAHVAVLTLLLGARDFDGAGKQWEAMKKVAPRNPQTLYFEAVIALQKGDAARVREITQLMLRAAPENPRLLMLAGQAELQLGSLTQAESMFGKAVQVLPKAVMPRRMLAEVQLRAGHADKALATIKPLLDAKVEDGDLLALAGRAQLLTGDAKAADASFARAAKAKPGDPRIRTTVALAHLGQGQGEAAFGELEAVAKSDSGSAADMALISARLQRKEYDAALKAIDALAVKQPKQAVPDYLRGRIALQKRDMPAARKHFDAALAKEPNYFPAVASLAGLDVLDGKPDVARARFETLLKSDPDNAQARMALAELSARSGASKSDVTQQLDAAIKAKPNAPVPRAALIDYYASQGDTKQALTAAQAAVAAIPGNIDLLDRLGRLQLASGDANQAIATFNKMQTLSPKSPVPHLRLADANEANKNSAAAAASVRRAMEVAPTSLAAQRAGITLALREKQPAQALAIARTIQTQRPNEGVGFMLEGEIELVQDKPDAAAAAFRKALAKPNPAEAAVRLHGTLLRANKQADADRMAESWLKDHPDDMAFVFHLGDVALGKNDLAQAETRYRQVLAKQPDNVLALNNVAYLMAKSKTPGAVAMAERAVKLAPNRAALMDTLALAYAQDGQLPKALETQAKVVALAPGMPDYRLNQARYQLQSGNKAAARADLEILAKLGKDYAGQAEVAKLQKTASE